MCQNRPNILVISHTSFTQADSMGATLASYLAEYDANQIAQFYIKEMTPDIPVCNRYFRVTDQELVQKLLHPMRGNIGKRVALQIGKNGSILPGSGAVANQKVNYQHRHAAMLLRNVVWSIGFWNNADFKSWVKEFSPQIILVQPGDFSYLIRMATKLSKELEIPLVIHQSEAYYLKPYYKKTPLYKLYRMDYARHFRKMMERAGMCVYLCDALKEDYDKIFDTPSCTIMKAAQLKPVRPSRLFGEGGIKFVYGGNLGETVGRCEPLVQMGRAVKQCGYHIDVYTNSTGEHMKELTEENGIVLHSAVSYEQLQTVIRWSDFVLHMENQSSWHKEDLKYAFSTKIADMLTSGICSIVYGSSEIASVRYFKQNELGCVIEDERDLYPRIRELIDSKQLREKYINAALKQAERFHNAKENARVMNRVIVSCVEKFEREKE